jgi:hypothetical protein
MLFGQSETGGRGPEGGLLGGLALRGHSQPDIRLQRLESHRHTADHRFCRSQPGHSLGMLVPVVVFQFP